MDRPESAARFFFGRRFSSPAEFYRPRRPRRRAADQGKFDEAIAEFRTAIRNQAGLRRSSQQPRHRAGHQKKFDEAIAEFRTAIRIKPDYAEAHINLGIALTDRDKLDEAIAEYRDGRPTQAGPRRSPQQPRHRAELFRRSSTRRSPNFARLSQDSSRTTPAPTTASASR